MRFKIWIRDLGPVQLGPNVSNQQALVISKTLHWKLSDEKRILIDDHKIVKHSKRLALIQKSEHNSNLQQDLVKYISKKYNKNPPAKKASVFSAVT